MTFLDTMKSFRKYGVSFVIQHSFCCILPLVGALIGANILPFHDPIIELLMAVAGALIGVKIDDFLHKKDLHDCACHEDGLDEHSHAHGHSHDESLRSNVKETATVFIKKYGLPLVFAFSIWGLHQAFFHKDHDHSQATSAAHSHIHADHDGHDH